MGALPGLVVVIWLLYLLIVLSCLSHSARRVVRWCVACGGQRSAERRAKALLRDLLSEAHYEHLLRCGYLEVTSPSIEHRVYRIRGAGGMVNVYERGCPIMDLCLQPIEPLPDADVVVLHLLLIEANEQEYLQKANHFAPRIIPLRGSQE